MRMISLQTNLPTHNALRNLQNSQGALEKSLQRLSSGYRINSSADDAAGLAISEKLRSQIRSMAQAQRNANDAISVVNIAEGSMQEVGNILVRLRELAVQAASDTLGSTERSYLDLEFHDLKQEIDRITATTEFNGTKLLDGSLSAVGYDIQVGTNNTADDRIRVTIDALHTQGMGITTATGVDTKAAAQTALSTVDGALTELARQRARLGAVSNRLSSTVNNLSIAQENMTAANARIRDVDVAMETSSFARSQVLVQAGVAMLAQANMTPQSLLRLLQ